jgi:hypothetical protein
MGAHCPALGTINFHAIIPVIVTFLFAQKSNQKRAAGKKNSPFPAPFFNSALVLLW